MANNQGTPLFMAQNQGTLKTYPHVDTLGPTSCLYICFSNNEANTQISNKCTLQCQF